MDAGGLETVEQFRNRSAAARAEIHDVRRSRRAQRAGEHRNARAMELEARFDEMEIVGRVVAHPAGKPGLVLELEQMPSSHRESGRRQRHAIEASHQLELDCRSSSTPPTVALNRL